ncbi:glycosyl hydrolase family 32 [Mucilaginibacter sp. HC2]|uniref:exo-alpha-sialidase n=1 Tax=Mucilaginibacter inviolabilis TaxID=2714892 RepID=UPI00140BBFC6|nr:exo-alpha-sialidase [Mucilaginibacter inviolabilis]NHA03634.1 glycosyl hydrolase family 32 [Mucilaginibacter inviolabilis]
MRKLLKFLLSIALFFSCNYLFAQTPSIRNNYQTEASVPRLKIERSMIYSPDKEWLYNHHPSIIHFKDRFIAIWSNGLIDEDSPGQRVVYATSTDFVHWSKPEVLASPEKFKDTLTVLTAAGLYQYKGTLVAYYGEYTKHRQNTHLWAKTSTDGIHWSNAIDMHVPLIPNHGPEITQSGRLIISGNFMFPYTDDPKGISSWKISSFYPGSLYTQDNSSAFYAPAAKLGLPPLCEGSFFETDDHVLHMLLRVTGKGWKGRLWLTESRNDGQSWSRPVETAFSDNDSKFHFGRLPDKRFYYVGIPDTLHHYSRNPLVLSLSQNGETFDKNYIIADELYHLKKEGLWKGGQYGYPHTIIYNGYMYVIISRQKEAIETLRFSLNQLR